MFKIIRIAWAFNIEKDNSYFVSYARRKTQVTCVNSSDS